MFYFCFYKCTTFFYLTTGMFMEKVIKENFRVWKYIFDTHISMYKYVFDFDRYLL